MTNERGIPELTAAIREALEAAVRELEENKIHPGNLVVRMRWPDPPGAIARLLGRKPRKPQASIDIRLKAAGEGSDSYCPIFIMDLPTEETEHVDAFAFDGTGPAVNRHLEKVTRRFPGVTFNAKMLVIENGSITRSGEEFARAWKK